tara:strand:+ start:405 stop:911 length:507 start_codon:yes stop_codon:yes gene_type:complete
MAKKTVGKITTLKKETLMSNKNTPAWIKNGWKKPGPKQPHSANYVKAGDARRIPNGKKQTGQWVRPTVEPSTKPLSRVLFTDERGSNIHLHAGDEARGTVCDRFLRSHRAKKQNKILFDEPQQARMVIQKNPKNFPLKSLRRIASILESHIRSLEWSQYNKKNAEGRK